MVATQFNFHCYHASDLSHVISCIHLHVFGIFTQDIMHHIYPFICISVSHLGYDPSHVVKSCISHVIMYLASCIHLFYPMIICIALMTWCIPCNQVLHFICRHASYIMHTYVSSPDCIHMHSKKSWSFFEKKKSTNLCVTNQAKIQKNQCSFICSYIHFHCMKSENTCISYCIVKIKSSSFICYSTHASAF